jgi:hypothetical protein
MSSTQEEADRKREHQEESQRAARRKQESGRLEGVVAAAVLRSLGRPPDFLRAGARQLWGNYYRVNIFAGPDAASARIAHSFFLEADADGKILTSSPPVARAY